MGQTICGPFFAVYLGCGYLPVIKGDRGAVSLAAAVIGGGGRHGWWCLVDWWLLVECRKEANALAHIICMLNVSNLVCPRKLRRGVLLVFYFDCGKVPPLTLLPPHPSSPPTLFLVIWPHSALPLTLPLP